MEQEYEGLAMEDKHFLISYNLQFFADSAGDKTEDATTKKLTDARKEGQVAKSQELVTAAALISLFLVLKTFIGFMGNRLLGAFEYYFIRIPDYVAYDFDHVVATRIFRDVLLQILIVAAPVFIVAFLVAFLVNIAQVKWKPTSKPLKPKLERINPLKGVKKMFSKDKLVELLKSLLKIAIMGYVIYDAMKDEWRMIQRLYDTDLIQAIVLIGTTVIDLGFTISIYFIFIAAADVFYQKFKFKKEMKMTKQEVKDEYKQSEGDPKVKGQIKQKMREAAQRRMMQDLPEADVVITNPTHLAVAIKYDRDKSTAPMLLAKGADHLAEKIKEAARENKVEIVENKPLARMLYYNVEIGDEIPQELYQMVAEVLAYVYGLKNN